MEKYNDVMSILTDISNYKKMLKTLDDVNNTQSFKIAIKSNIIDAINELERRLKLYEVEA